MITPEQARTFAHEWIEAWNSHDLDRIPDLRFELIEVLTGAGSLTIYYKAVLGKLGAEVFFLDDSGRAWKAMAHYDR